MDDRTKMILSEVIKNKSLTVEGIANNNGLTRYQIEHVLYKTNILLQGKGLGNIIINDQDKLDFPNEFDHFLVEYNILLDDMYFISSPKERAHMLIIIMCTVSEDLSANYFSEEFRVSNNTIFNDLKKAKEEVNHFECSIEYSRRSGYEIRGTEWNIRNCMLQSINFMMRNKRGALLLKHYMKITVTEFNLLQMRIKAIESELKLYYAEESYHHLVYFFIAIFRRFNQFSTLEDIFFVGYEELLDTREFLLMDEFTENLELSKSEKMYMALHLLSSNIYHIEKKVDDELPELTRAIEMFLDEFQRKSCIVFKNKNELISRIFFHLKPAYYRIRYRLSTPYKIIPTIAREYSHISVLVEKSIQPIESFLESDIPEIEIDFLSILVAAYIDEKSNPKFTETRAVIVCQNGISMSVLFSSILKKMFPQFYFYEVMSIKDFELLDSKSYDIVFTTTFLKNEKPIYLIKNLNTIDDFNDLRNKVILDFYKIGNSEVMLSQIVNLIEKHTDSFDKINFIPSILSLFGEYDNSFGMNHFVPATKNITDILTPSNIIKVNHHLSWQEGLEIAGNNLLLKNKISPEYLKKVTDSYKELDSSIVLRGNIAIPHSIPDYKSTLSMSLVILEQPIVYEDGKEVHFILFISTPNKEEHINALLQVYELAGDDSFLEEIQKMTSEEIYEKLEKYKFIERE
ncbi:BglG family transcription antiterminator [Vagococcus luciliae]|nr:BglG family transcription antiterminator [Vagococcus luciliae]